MFPLGIGLIGANIVKEIPGARVELFKYPTDLDAALTREIPDVCGFSCYSWNTYLGMEYAQRIKARWPHITIIAGGPNYEPQDFWEQFGGFIDYFVYREGEAAVVELLKGNTGFHGIHTAIVRREPGPRIGDLDRLPSPYTARLMDKFFDGVLIPLVHSTRGCPFSCTFCQEGAAYYNKVAKRHTLSEDLEYIGQRVGTVKDLYFSDANVGMFKEDADKARAIAQVQAKYGWPEYIHCSAGKNHKDRVLEFSKIIGGKMGVAASLQSTDAEVLANVKRANISSDELMAVAQQGSAQDANVYSEIILNLPGDTLQKHVQSLRDAVNSGVNYLRMYQLIMLPETEMNTPETRAKFGIKTMWRIMPRCFGRYPFHGDDFVCAEIEEIAVSQDSLTFEDYQDAREWDLTVEIFHNSGIFRELFGLCSVCGVEWFSLLHRVHQARADYLPGLYADFRRATVAPLWDNREKALAFAQANIDCYLSEELGQNELFSAKAVAFFRMQYEIHDAIYSIAAGVFPERYRLYLEEARRFSLARKRDLLDPLVLADQWFNFDFHALIAKDFREDPLSHQCRSLVSFAHRPQQTEIIRQLVRQYGTSVTGLGRILLRSHVNKLFRHVEGMEVQDVGYRRASMLYGD